MNENLVALQAAVDLTRNEVLQLARNAFAVTWLGERDKDRYLGALEDYGAGPG